MNDPQRLAEEIVQTWMIRDFEVVTKKKRTLVDGRSLSERIAEAITAHGQRRWDEAAQEKEEEIRSLREALEKYVAHKEFCQSIVTNGGGPCTCGLVAALSSSPPRKSEYEEEKTKGCPCYFTKPCSDYCACLNRVSSHGCKNCCSYGSLQQKTAQAKRLVSSYYDGFNDGVEAAAQLEDTNSNYGATSGDEIRSLKRRPEGEEKT